MNMYKLTITGCDSCPIYVSIFNDIRTIDV